MADKSAADKAMEEMLEAASKEKEENTNLNKAIEAMIKVVRKDFLQEIRKLPKGERSSFIKGMHYYHIYHGRELLGNIKPVSDTLNMNRLQFQNYFLSCLTADCRVLNELVEELKKG